MKRALQTLVLLGIILVSCADNSEKFAIAATELCDCMNESSDDETNMDDVKMNMGVCLLGSKVNLKDSEMLIQVEENCPELKEEFVAFLQRMESK